MCVKKKCRWLVAKEGGAQWRLSAGLEIVAVNGTSLPAERMGTCLPCHNVRM